MPLPITALRRRRRAKVWREAARDQDRAHAEAVARIVALAEARRHAA